MRRALVLAACVACGSYGSEDAPVAAPERDASVPPSESTEAIYVAPAGRDFAEGTKSAPVATFARALVLSAEHGGADIVACVATYSENVVVDRKVTIHGDRSCKDWSPFAGRARIDTLFGIALTVRDASDVVIEDFEVQAAADHTRPGSPAVGALVIRANNVTLRRVDVKALPGADGPDGATSQNYANALPPFANNATVGTGGAAVMTACLDGSSSRGGAGAAPGMIPESGSANPVVGGANAGVTGTTCMSGTKGASGLPGDAASSPAQPFVVGMNGVETTNGARGANGAPGQGGGGGGANSGTLGGGGGGCGGCGGGGGFGGMSGGSSVAVVASASSLMLDGCVLVASDAGKGGRGAIGQDGQQGTSGGAGACNGGAGGPGAGGGGGAGGAGGHSIAIAFDGAEPKRIGGSTAFGLAGAGGPGGMGGTTGKPGANGPAGIASATLKL